MKRRPKQTPVEDSGGAPSATAAEAGLQIKVWLIGISPMVWRRVLVPAAFTLRELHGVIQVAMGWEGIHLFQFCLQRRVNLPSRLRRHRSLRLSRQNDSLPTKPLVPFSGSISVPDGTAFATKPRLAVRMIERAIAAGVPFAWVAADSVYGVGEGEAALRRAGEGYVLGVNSTHQFRSWQSKPPVAGTAEEIAGRVDPS